MSKGEKKRGAGEKPRKTLNFREHTAGGQVGRGMWETSDGDEEYTW